MLSDAETEVELGSPVETRNGRMFDSGDAATHEVSALRLDAEPVAPSVQRDDTVHIYEVNIAISAASLARASTTKCRRVYRVGSAAYTIVLFNILFLKEIEGVKGEPKHRYAKSHTYYYDICLYNNGTIYLQNIQTRFVINLIISCSNVCKSPYW